VFDLARERWSAFTDGGRNPLLLFLLPAFFAFFLKVLYHFSSISIPDPRIRSASEEVKT
jgi:hypothetical protein